MKRFKGENKGAFSLSRAIIALSVFGIATTCIPIAISSYNAEIKSLCTINSASKKLLCELYKKYEYTNAAYADIFGDNTNEPMAMDLDGDGVIEISSPQDGIYFDFNGDGFAEKIAWTTKGDGVLAIDLNQNGKIDDGTEIIKDGQLTFFDSNKDGKITKEDSSFELFRIIKSDGSLKTLDEENVTEIIIKTKPCEYYDKYHNNKFAEGQFKKSDGKTYRFDEYFFIADMHDCQEVDIIRELPSVSKLPDIKCQGTLHSLHQAMMRDEQLQKLVEKFVKESNESKRLELTTQIILKWAKAENAGTAKNIDVQHLRVVEAFMGYRFGSTAEKQEVVVESIESYSAKQIETIYLKLENYVYAELMSQTHLSDLKKLIKTDKNGKTDLTGATNKLQREMFFNPKYGKERVLEFARMVKGLGLDKNSNFLDPKNPDCFYLKFTENDRDLKWKIDTIAKIPMFMDKSKIVNGELKGTMGDDAYQARIEDLKITNYFHSQEGDDVLYGCAEQDILVGCDGEDMLDGGDGDDILISNTDNDIIFGGKGNDRIYAGEDDDIIFGGDGDDIIHPDGVDKSGKVKVGDRGNDIVVGGKGNDIIVSYVGDDTFVFNLGDGNDTIIEKQGTDTLYFGKGISWKNLKFERNGLDMVISIKNTNDSITVKDWFAEGQVGDNNNIIEIFEFANGEKHTYKDIVVK